MLLRYTLILFLGLFTSETGFAIHPAKEYISTPSQSGMKYDSLNIPTSDHFRITGWYCKPETDTTNFLLILAGGDAGNMSYDVPLARFLTQNFNVPVLLFDYRGFGTSQAFAYDSTAIVHPEYLMDMDAAVSFARKNYPGRKIILYGRSLGASLAVVEGEMVSGITGIIAESPYASQAQLVKRILENNPTLTLNPIASNKLEPLQNIEHFQAKGLLLLHGMKEKFIYKEDVESLMAAPITNKKFYDFADCDHLEMPFKDPQHFGDAIAEFLANCR